MLRKFTAVVVASLLPGACGSPDSAANEREADVYAAVIRTLATEEADQTLVADGEIDRVVFAGPLDDEVTIPLEVQAAVVETLEDFATIRFVDRRSEAIDRREEDEPVLEDGVLVLLEAVPSGPSFSIEAERYVHTDDFARFDVGLEERAGEWHIVTLNPEE